MQADATADRHRIRRAYERGRLRTALRRASLVVAPVAVIALASGGARALAWIPLTFAVWVMVHWRGGPLLRGAFFGLAGGAVTWLLPLTILRPCCSPTAMAQGESCCTMPGACGLAGALVGIALAACVPAGAARWRTAAGVALGLSSVAVLRCAMLFGAEAFGLLGGLVAGVFAATAASAVLRQPRRS